MTQLVCALLLAGGPAVETVWRMGRVAGPLAPDVRSVTVENDAVVVRSAGISLADFGALAKAPAPSAGAREFVFRIPRRPRATGAHARVTGEYGGVFVNGVPMYNQFEAASWQGQNLWHYDLARGGGGLLAGLLAGNGRHSPIIGFALDGFPVYGPWSERGRMRSSYKLRQISRRDRWPDGTAMAPGQEGPAVDAANPLGTFAEDYEFVAGSGELDRFNGAIVKTPEYPEGTYAYFLSTDARGEMAFPYLLGAEFYGEMPGAGAGFAAEQEKEGVRFGVSDGELRFQITGSARHLEFVHERPLHVFVISEDLREFAHVHPEADGWGVWRVRYGFPRAGRYRVYASFTMAGGQPQTVWFDVARGAGRGAGLRRAEGVARLENDGEIRAGEESELRFRVKVANWQPYLGAWAHVVAVGEGLSGFQHAHPTEGAGAHDHAGPRPELLRVPVLFPQAGRYRVWLQVRDGEEVKTAAFDVTVNAGNMRVEAAGVPAGAVRVRVGEGGFQPARISARAGEAVTLAFQRDTAPNCGGRVVFPELGIEKTLAAGAVTLVTLPAGREREIRFACGMGMYRGSVTAVSEER